MSIFHDESGNIKKTLLCEDAEQVANQFVFPSDRKAITSAQLRRFYNDFKCLEKKFQFKQGTVECEDPFLSILPLIKMQKSKVAYAVNPKKPKIPKEFETWMKKNIDAIATPKDFEAFLLHFEAVVGFCYGLGLSD